MESFISTSLLIGHGITHVYIYQYVDGGSKSESYMSAAHGRGDGIVHFHSSVDEGWHHTHPHFCGFCGWWNHVYTHPK